MILELGCWRRAFKRSIPMGIMRIESDEVDLSVVSVVLLLHHVWLKYPALTAGLFSHQRNMSIKVIRRRCFLGRNNMGGRRESPHQMTSILRMPKYEDSLMESHQRQL